MAIETKPSVQVLMREWETQQPTQDSNLCGQFLDSDPVVRSVASEINRSGKLEIIELVDGLHISSCQYVGSIRLGGLRITITPKLTGLPLLNLLRYAYRLRNLELFTPLDYGSEASAFQELLIFQLFFEAKELVARGLHRKYERISQDLASPKGRIDFRELSRRGGVQEASLPCIHYLRLEDNLLNQTLLAGLLHATRLTNDISLKTQLRGLIQILEQEVSFTRLDLHLLARTKRSIDRLTSVYQPALTIIELLLEAEGISLESDERKVRLPGFLFDMNHFFQALISRFLNENLPGFEVRDEYRLLKMMEYDRAHNPNRRKPPTPRPDFAILKEGKVVTYLDTKYRDLWVKELPRDMLYQLAIYAISLGEQGKATILYPTLEKEASEAWVEIQHPLTGNKLGRVILRPVNMLLLEFLITSPQTVTNTKAKASYAHQLAFG